MATSTDVNGFLTATDLCALVDIKRPRRANWAEQGLVRKARPKEGYNERDAAELVAFVALVRRLEFEDAKLVWSEVRDPLRRASVPECPTIVVIDQERKSGQLLDRLEDVGAGVRPGHPFVLLDLTEPIRDALEVCGRLRRAREVDVTSQSPRSTTNAPNVHRLRQRAT